MAWNELRALVVVAIVAICSTVFAQGARFDVNDLAYLWPAPKAAGDVDGLLSAAEPIGTDSTLWPQEAFAAVLDAARETRVFSSAGQPIGINFIRFADASRELRTWKVVAFRVDPSAPGGHASVVEQFGSTPQIRLVLQPVTVANGEISAHDFAAHLAFSFIASIDPTTRRPVPDKAAFSAIVKDLVALKTRSEMAGVATAGPLRVHPALEREVAGFQAAVVDFLKRWLPRGRLTEMAFMGINAPQPWIFFAMARGPGGAFVQVTPPSLAGQNAQMLTFNGGEPVMPMPQTTNVNAGAGVSTAMLFRRNASGAMGTPVFPDRPLPVHADIPDIIANPRLSHVRNTDCVSCHTETRRRLELEISSTPGTAFERPSNVSGVAPEMLPKESWNVRNFGWFQRDNAISPTVTVRTSNEAAEATALVNEQYLGQ